MGIKKKEVKESGHVNIKAIQEISKRAEEVVRISNTNNTNHATNENKASA
jgi:hypothetical protein